MCRQFQFLGSLGLFVLAINAFAQTGPTVVDVAYARNVPYVAPGQIVRLHVTALKAIPALSGDVFLKATSTPLPTTLGGISVVIRQYHGRYLSDPLTLVGTFNAPFLSISQANLCFTSTGPDCIMTFLTVQIPYDLGYGNDGRYVTEIAISQNGVESQSFTVATAGLLVHVVNTGDSREDVPAPLSGPNLSPGESVVAHADGTPVSASAPASPDEVVVIYAWGLGNTTPAVRAGDVTPTPAPVVSGGIGIRFDFRPNAGATSLLEAQATAPAYLTPGQVGLYQVNVRLPSAFPAVQSCGGNVQSNLTITLSSSWSSDGAAICVQPPE
jgi:uncharacterized protein (TIGR03437 family)